VDETAASQAELRRLLNAAVPATVGFALKQLVMVQKAGLLDVEEALAALPPATLVKAKGTALAALGLARSVSAHSPGSAAKVAQAALGHPHADVQRAAIALLAECGESDAVLTAAEDLAPSVRHELGLQSDVPAPQADPTRPSRRVRRTPTWRNERRLCSRTPRTSANSKRYLQRSQRQELKTRLRR
jgi:hypothetical protein